MGGGRGDHLAQPRDGGVRQIHIHIHHREGRVAAAAAVTVASAAGGDGETEAAAVEAAAEAVGKKDGGEGGFSPEHKEKLAIVTDEAAEAVGVAVRGLLQLALVDPDSDSGGKQQQRPGEGPPEQQNDAPPPARAPVLLTLELGVGTTGKRLGTLRFRDGDTVADAAKRAGSDFLGSFRR